MKRYLGRVVGVHRRDGRKIGYDYRLVTALLIIILLLDLFLLILFLFGTSFGA